MTDDFRSHHAVWRLRGRAIPEAAIELLYRFGESVMQAGCEVLFFDRPARRRVAEALGREGARVVERWLDAYLVVSPDGVLVTAGWRTRRLRRR